MVKKSTRLTALVVLMWVLVSVFVGVPSLAQPKKASTDSTAWVVAQIKGAKGKVTVRHAKTDSVAFLYRFNMLSAELDSCYLSVRMRMGATGPGILPEDHDITYRIRLDSVRLIGVGPDKLRPDRNSPFERDYEGGLLVFRTDWGEKFIHYKMVERKTGFISADGYFDEGSFYCNPQTVEAVAAFLNRYRKACSAKAAR